MAEDEMGHASEKIVQSVLLTAWSRLSMALALPLIAALIWFGKAYIDDKFADATKDIATAQEVATEASVKAAEMDRRLVTVETTQASDARATDKFQKSTLDRLDRIQESMVNLSNSVSALNATIKTVVEDRRRPPG